MSARNTTTGRSRSVPEIQQQAEAGEHQKYNNRQKQVSARNTTTGRSRSRQQYNNYQEQVCCADCLPSGAHHRHSCTRPIQQHTGICQYTTAHHSAEQRRARKGGARGGKAGFVTPSAFPPRKPAHAKVSPRKGKAHAKVSPRKGKAHAKVSPRKGKAHAKVSPLEREKPSARSIRQTPDIVQYLVQFSHYFYQ